MIAFYNGGYMQMPDLEKMCRFERDIEKVLEDACEKDGWICTVAISPGGVASMFVEKFGGCPIAASDEKAAVSRCMTFIKEEFGAMPNVDDKTLTRFGETIPNTCAPYHVTYRFNVDVRDRIAALAA